MSNRHPRWPRARSTSRSFSHAGSTKRRHLAERVPLVLEEINYRDFARSLYADWVVLQWTTNGVPSASVQKDHIRLIGAEYRSVVGSADEYPWSRMLSMLAPYMAIVDLLTDFCRAHQIEVVNLLPALAQHRASTLWVHEPDHHPNRRAHAIAAEDLARASR